MVAEIELLEVTLPKTFPLRNLWFDGSDNLQPVRDSAKLNE